MQPIQQVHVVIERRGCGCMGALLAGLALVALFLGPRIFANEALSPGVVALLILGGICALAYQRGARQRR